jgi:protein tyrosine phosphatase (PTP) superfamily phosphohydrolase (DUF442 family)
MNYRTPTAIATIVVSVGLATGLTLHAHREAWVWDHWDVVKPGVLYRSGALTPGQLEAAAGRFGIRTVVSFLRPGPAVERERAECRRLGITFINLPMPGDGFGQEDQFREVLAACDDPERRPVLVHCARGTCRTGAAVALYRFERDGWTVEDVDREMRRQAYRPGWLPGYVYAMVGERPFGELYEPRKTIDPPPPRTESRNGQ